jgi:hypothetical protein
MLRVFEHEVAKDSAEIRKPPPHQRRRLGAVDANVGPDADAAADLLRAEGD